MKRKPFDLFLLIFTSCYCCCCLILAIRSAGATAAAAESMISYEEIIIKKPYTEVCDDEMVEETIELVDVDQTRVECPLELNSSSVKTGCVCNFSTLTIDCPYTNRLDEVPKFYDHTPSAHSRVEWSIDLRCKNFTSIPNFEPFMNLSRINLLDLSGFRTNATPCRTSVIKTNKSPQTPVESANVTAAAFLRQIGNEPKINWLEWASRPKKPNFNKKNYLHVEHLNMSCNQLSKVYLFNNETSPMRLSISNLILEKNMIVEVYLRTSIDICDLHVKELSLAYNLIRKLDLGYLIFLRRLNVSNNQLTTFDVDFYDNRDFVDYYRHVCNLTTVLAAEQVYVSNLVEVDFSCNFLRHSPFANLRQIQFDSLRRLDMRSNLLATLNGTDFTRLHTLTHLNLQSNKIEHVHARALADLRQLKFLDLSCNFIKQIPGAMFESQHASLETLLLNNNKLEVIPKAAFANLQTLKYLNLNRNQIHVIGNYSFGYMANLFEIYLAENRIHTVEFYAFHIDVRSLVGPGLVEKLDLSRNQLTGLNASMFYYLTNLRYLLLNNNQIARVDAQTFAGVHYLIEIDLSFNRLQELDFMYSRNFSHLRYLKLSNNRLGVLKPGQFVHLKALNLLDLSSNKLKYISDCAFVGLEASIKRLYLNYNQIKRINSCAFAINFLNLRFVQILFNPLNCTNNCEFFFTIYNPPYSINYEGIECVNVTRTNFTYCSPDDYDQIYRKCKQKLTVNNCSKYVDLDEHEYVKLVAAANQDESAIYDYTVDDDINDNNMTSYFKLSSGSAENGDRNRAVISSSSHFMGYLFLLSLTIVHFA